MTRYPRFNELIVPLLVGALTGCPAIHATDQPESKVALSQTLPALDGANLKVTVVEVRYGPGGRSGPHSHPCPVVGYVIDGTYRTQVKGGQVEVLRAGQSFYEPANGVHQVSANASETEPVRFLATFVCDRSAPLSSPVPSSE